jgi:bla regulator protein blaR1
MSLGASDQAAEATSEFEVASIRLNKTGLPRRGSMEFSRGGERFTATNMPLGPLILTAYNITVRQISVPASFPDDRYDIAAKADRPLSPAEMRHMLQQLLVDRFKLVVHREIKEIPVYALAIGKGGQKLRQSQERESEATPRTPSRAGGTELGTGHIIFKNESMPDFAWALSRTIDTGDRVVVDQTGLVGNYDFELTFGRDNEPTAGADGRESATPQLPSIFSALQDQLGLRLEPTKASVEFLVVVHVEKPSDN